MRCKACRYPLTNLAERRCPECGRAFDPGNPKTFENNPVVITPTLVGIALLSCVAVWVTIRFVSYDAPNPADPNDGMAFLTAIDGCCGALLIGPLVFSLLILIRLLQLRR